MATMRKFSLNIQFDGGNTWTIETRNKKSVRR